MRAACEETEAHADLCGDHEHRICAVASAEGGRVLSPRSSADLWLAKYKHKYADNANAKLARQAARNLAE